MRRLQFPREFYLPKTKLCKVTAKGDLATVYLYTSPKGKPSAVAFIGKALKPAWHFTFSDAAGRERRIAELFRGLAEHEVRKAERRRASNAGHTLKVGDIITNSWGYDQTNVDFYRITRTSKNYVWLIRIASKSVPSNDGGSSMSGHVVADKDAPALKGYREEKRKAEGSRVSMEHGSGSLWDGRPLYESWYA